jgi:hypothetical protein
LVLTICRHQRGNPPRRAPPLSEAELSSSRFPLLSLSLPFRRPPASPPGGARRGSTAAWGEPHEGGCTIEAPLSPAAPLHRCPAAPLLSLALSLSSSSSSCESPRAVSLLQRGSTPRGDLLVAAPHLAPPPLCCRPAASRVPRLNSPDQSQLNTDPLQHNTHMPCSWAALFNSPLYSSPTTRPVQFPHNAIRPARSRSLMLLALACLPTQGLRSLNSLSRVDLQRDAHAGARSRVLARSLLALSASRG